MDELKSSVPMKQETNVFHQTSLKNRAINPNDIYIAVRDQLSGDYSDIEEKYKPYIG